MLTCNDYYILTISYVFSCHGSKLPFHISNPFICQACSAMRSSLRSWIKRFPSPRLEMLLAELGWRSRAHKHFGKHFSAEPGRVAQPSFSSSSHPNCPLLVLQDYQGALFFCSGSFSPAWMKELSLSTKEGPCVILSRNKATPSSIFQESPFSTTSVSQQIPLRKASSALPWACLEGLCGFEAPLRLFISMTSDHCESLWSRIRTLLHLTIYETD